VDLDIRYGAARWPNLHVETIFTEKIVPLISPRLKEKLNIKTPGDLLHQDLIFQMSTWCSGPDGLQHMVCPKTQLAMRSVLIVPIWSSMQPYKALVSH